MDHGKTARPVLDAGCAGAVEFLSAVIDHRYSGNHENWRCPWIESRRSPRQFARRAKNNSRSFKCEAANSFFGNLRNRTSRLRAGGGKISNAVVEFDYEGD